MNIRIILFFTLFSISNTFSATILIDPGHGGEENGAISSVDGSKEKDLAMELALLIRNQLLSGHHVYLSRTSDQTLKLEQRAGTAQRIGADIFISVHMNSSESKHSHGFETYYLSNDLDEATKKVVRVENGEHSHPMKGVGEVDSMTGEILAEIVVSENIPESKKLGELVHSRLKKSLPNKYKIKDRGLKPGLFYVLAMTKVPGILLEAGFLSSQKDLELMKNREYLNDYAKNVAEGVNHYFSSIKKLNNSAAR
jgi:N-acetylmuramoyl-L-alanine amidase